MPLIKTLLTLALSSAVLPVLSQTLPNYVPTASLVGWWGFAGNANDLSGHGHDGTVTGAALTADRNNTANSAYSFNGSSSYISVASTGVTNVTRTTVAAWVKYTGDAGGTPYDTYFQFGTYGSHSFGYAYNYSGTNLDNYRHCQNTFYRQTNLKNSWHHIVSVQDSLNTRVYIDGVFFDSTTSMYPNCYSGTNDLLFGASPSDNQWVTGSLDDIGFWTRALSDCEIYTLYHASVLGFATQPAAQTGSPGSSVAFTCSVNSGAMVAYQWQSNTGAGGSFTDITNGGQYSGANTNRLAVSNLTTANNNQRFRCIVTISPVGCNAVSSEAALTIQKTGIAGSTVTENHYLSQNTPNPSGAATTIQYSVIFKQSAQLVFTDMLGKKVKEASIINNGTGSISVDLSNMGSGIYFYTLISDGRRIDARKMVVCH